MTDSKLQKGYSLSPPPPHQPVFLSQCPWVGGNNSWERHVHLANLHGFDESRLTSFSWLRACAARKRKAGSRYIPPPFGKTQGFMEVWEPHRMEHGGTELLCQVLWERKKQHYLCVQVQRMDTIRDELLTPEPWAEVIRVDCLKLPTVLKVPRWGGRLSTCVCGEDLWAPSTFLLVLL